ncbi:hypothetical protein ACP70R_023885 [Stipagrostis hirtigluma subsp. patula]
MASPAAASSIIFLLLAAFAALASAATLTVTNMCNSTVWPAATPVGGGVKLNPGRTWTINVPAGTRAGRVWGRSGCSFNGGGRGSCHTGDCAGALACSLSGKPPMTLAEFTIGGGQDFYDISVVDGYNLPMAFSCSSGVSLRCGGASCHDASSRNSPKIHVCHGNSNYHVTFCP